MTRRDFLRGVAGSAAATLVPTWAFSKPHPINLKAFCSDGDPVQIKSPLGSTVEYDLSSPFVQAIGERSFAYATDGRICIRVEDTHDADSEPRRLPPVERLPWVENLAWKPWPAKHWQTAKNSLCPKCEGEGFVVERGMAGPCELCDERGYGTFPGLQRVGTQWVAWEYDARIRRHLRDVEYADIWTPTNGSMILAIRFSGGYGMQASVRENDAMERMKR